MNSNSETPEENGERSGERQGPPTDGLSQVHGASKNQHAPPKRNTRVWTVTLILVSLIAFYQLRDLPNSLSAQWNLNSAQEAAEKGDWDKAFAEADKAVARFPDSRVYADRARLYYQRANELRRNGQLEEAREMAQSALNDTENAIGLLALADFHRLRAGIYESLDDFRESVNEYTLYIQSSQSPAMYDAVDNSLADGLNARAYMRALGEFEIEEALEDIDKALKILPDDHPNRFTLEDTRGYLLYLDGRAKEAVPILDECVADAEQLYDQVAEANADGGSQIWLEQAAENLAVILHHRGLAYQAVGESAAAEADLKRAKELGFNFERGVR